MKSDPDTRSLTPAVEQTLRSVRIKLRKYILLHALLIIACWCLFFYWLGGLLDYLPVTVGSDETPRWLRIGLLLVMVLGSLWTLIFWAAPRWLARIQDRSLALLIERHYPQLDNQLVTAVELQQRFTQRRLDPEWAALEELEVSNPEANRQMLDRVQRQLEQRIGEVDTGELFDWKPIWAGTIALILALAVTGLAFLAMPSWMTRWSKRLFALSDETWPRKAELRADGIQIQLPAFTGQLAADRKLLPFVDGVVRLARGAPALLQISANASSKQVPEVCTMFYESESGARGRANLRRIGNPQYGWQQFVLDGPPLDGIAEDLTLDVVGLDARLSDLRLETIDPAVITELRLELQYADYLSSSLTRPPVETLDYRNGMRIPQGTRVTVLGKASAELNEVQFVVHNAMQAETADRIGVKSVTPEGSQLAMDRFAIDLGVLDASRVLEIRVIDRYGLSSDQIPRYVLSVQEDTVPEVSSRLVGIGNAVTPEAVIPVQGTIRDDHGIAEVAAELARNEEEPVDLELPNPEDGDFEVEIDLRILSETGKFAVAPGDTLGLMITAKDFFNLDGGSHLGSGQPKQLMVVTADELLVILDREELELRQRLEVIISELQQLADTLTDLSGSETASAILSTTPRFVALTQDGSADDQAARRRMDLLKAQQSVLQGDKSEQEILGVAVNVESLRQQLENNRIDSYDRQQRLLEKVYQPLMAVLDNEYPQLKNDLAELQSASMSGDGSQQARAALRSLSAVLARLAEVKENMKYLESFNEIIDLVRSLLEDQERVLEETEKKQREQILQLLQQ